MSRSLDHQISKYYTDVVESARRQIEKYVIKTKNAKLEDYCQNAG